ncbi:MAG: hypothetical protein VXZ72_01445 [Chlamydiota bacterium]|nr:hypothetical protein [Chlamydiota bacterium]
MISTDKLVEQINTSIEIRFYDGKFQLNLANKEAINNLTKEIFKFSNNKNESLKEKGLHELILDFIENNKIKLIDTENDNYPIFCTKDQKSKKVRCQNTNYKILKKEAHAVIKSLLVQKITLNTETNEHCLLKDLRSKIDQLEEEQKLREQISPYSNELCRSNWGKPIGITFLVLILLAATYAGIHQFKPSILPNSIKL